jgi:hypothetical protein
MNTTTNMLFLLLIMVTVILLPFTTAVCTNLNSNVEVHMYKTKKDTRTFIVGNTLSWKQSSLTTGWIGLGIPTKRTLIDGLLDVYLIKMDTHQDTRLFHTRMEQSDMIVGNLTSSILNVTAVPDVRLLAKNSYYGFGKLNLQLENNHTMNIVLIINYDQVFKNREFNFMNPQEVLTGTLDPSGPSSTYRCQNSNATNISLTEWTYIGLYKFIGKVQTSVYSICLALYFSCLVCVLLLRRSVLVRSRYSTFVVCIVFVVTATIAVLSLCIVFHAKHPSIRRAELLNLLAWYNASAAITAGVQSMLYASVSVLYTVSIIRYFIIRNLNKLLQKQNKIFKLNSLKLFNFYRIAGSKKIMFLVSLFLGVAAIVTVMTLGIVSYHSFHVFDDVVEVFLIVPMYIFISGGIIALCGLIIDSILNKKILWNQGRVFQGILNYFQSDPLMIRMEMLLCGISMLFYLIIIIVTHVKIHSLSASTAFLLFYIPCMIFMSPLYFFGLFPCLIEIWRKIKFTIIYRNIMMTEATKRDMIESVLTDPESLGLLKDYAAQEFSLENIALWEQLWKYKIKGGMKLKKTQKIYDMFLSYNSTMEVNVPAKTKKIIHQILKDNSMTPENQIPFESFSALYKDVLANINETFTRFSTTSEYKAKEIENYLLVNEYMMDNTVLASSYMPLINEEQ